MSNLAGRAALLAATLPYRDVPVPELGQGTVVRVQQMSVSTRVAYYSRITAYHDALDAYDADQQLPPKSRANISKPADLDVSLLALVHSIVDASGAKLFDEADIPAINSNWAQNAVTRIYDEIITLNEYQRDVKKLIEAEKKD